MSVVAVCTGVFLVTTSSGSPSDLRDRLLREAPVQWNAYERKAVLIRATSKLQSQGLTFEDGFSANATCRMLLRKRIDEPETTLYAVNPDYSFELRRSRDKDAWNLFDVQLATAEHGLPGRAAMTARDNNWPQLLVIRFYDEKLSELVAMPEFKIIAIEPDDSGLVRLEFECHHDKGSDQTKMYAIQSGSVLLDPARYWCMREGQVHASQGQSKVIRSFRATVDERLALPLPIHYETTEEWYRPDGTKSPYNPTVTADVSYDIHGEVPGSSEFRLSAFGLPEPPGLPKRTGWHIAFWLLNGLGIALVVIGVLYHARRRRAS